MEHATDSAALTLFKSSAGSGKTFTLVKEYLKIVLREPRKYRQVLAVTFTNKATEEMKTRIISALSQLANGTAAELVQNPTYQILRPYFDQLPDGDQIDIPRQARKVLNGILNDYSSFSVSTIESFFQRVVRAFARELDIPLGYDVEMQQDRVISRLVDSLMLEVGKDPDLTKLMMGYAERNLERDKGWNLDLEIRGLGRRIFEEKYQRLLVRFDWREVRISKMLELGQLLRKQIITYETYLQKLADQAMDMIYAEGLVLKDFAYGTSGPVGFFFNIQNKREFEPKTRFVQAVENPDKWATKKSDMRSQVMILVHGGLQDIAVKAYRYIQQNRAGYETAKLVERNLYAFGVMQRLEDLLIDYRMEQGALMISDSSFLLNKVVQEPEDCPFVFEKIGTQFQHYLLDEFQDTSNMQWNNLLPLVLEAMSHGHENLIVGDVKQSIYRWRNGNMRLLLDEVEGQMAARHQPFEVSQLDTNWRTAAEIVDFNNRFFEACADMLGSQYQEQEKHLVDLAYGHVAQNASLKQVPGLVEITWVEPPKPLNFRTIALYRLVEVIEDLKAEGWKGGDITVLVRTNAEGTEVATKLQEEGHRVVSADSLLIRSDARVRFFLALFQYLDQESDQISLAALNHHYATMMKSDNVMFEVSHEALHPELVEQLDDQKVRLRNLSVYACAEELVRMFPVLAAPNAYVQGFVDALLEYIQQEETSIAGFLEWWSDQAGRRSIAVAPDEEAVQVMTIHKSKGLEFPIVILPFANWTLKPKSDTVLWVEPEEEPFKAFGFLPVNASSNLEESLFGQEYRDELFATGLDNLNGLYVACTRPKYRLYAFTQKKGSSKEMGNVKDLFSLFRKSHEDLGKVDKWEFGENWTIGTRQRIASKSADTGGMINLQSNPRPMTQWDEAIRVSFSLNPKSRQDILQVQRSRTRGELIHEVLAHVEVLADIPAAADKMILQGKLSQDEREALLEDLRQTVTRLPQLKDWFSGNWKVKSEADIIHASGKLLRPDRVMMRAQHAVVLDYKTGMANSKHAGQVQQYMEALTEMGFTTVEGYLYYVESGDLVQVG
ncbi:UvrD-helicase domain-containing protein [Pontibacter sp. G13]|uniref:UvrD-helicase domain-containing protein n=1 Tax=Pontibacter sp. G13 TaxID=3074898 RepID=UPI00288B338E|nr:UvrD-helicase domain-containing protein [Pontibacter sp. G13]WNJ18570.1 UvrD-helicase domain-containing protein [Pontibacter sp. G13]